VRFDEKAGSDLRESVTDANIDDHLADELVCPACHSTHDLDATDCDCENDVPLKRRQLAVLDSVDAYHDNLQLTSEGDGRVTCTTNPIRQCRIPTPERERPRSPRSIPDRRTSYEQTKETYLERSEYGDYSVLLYTDGYRTKYKSGEVDAQESHFEVCGEENCHGVIYEDDDETRRCSADPDHFPEGEERTLNSLDSGTNTRRRVCASNWRTANCPTRSRTVSGRSPVPRRRQHP